MMATISTPKTSPSTPLASHERAGGEPRRPGIFSPAGAVLLLMLAGGFIGLFFRWFANQHHFSTQAMEDWGHVYLIPVVSGGLIWLKREKIFATQPRVFWPGIAPFLLGIVAYFFCVVGVKNHMLQGFSMILTIFGLTLLLLGPAMMRWLFLPIAYLGFGITISEMIMNYLTFPLKLVASKGAGLILTFLANLFDFGVEVDGNNITMTTRAGVQQAPLNVADACSGMRMVIAFVALAAAIALIRCRFWWQRVAVILLSIPVAVGLNVIRVAALGVASLFDQNLATGDAHMLIGTLLLIPGFFVFLGVVWVLERVVKDDDAAVKKPIKTQAAAKVRIPWPAWFSRPVEWSALTRPAFIVPVLILCLAGAGFGAGIRAAGIYLQKLPIYAKDNRPVRDIPRVTASWEQVGNDRIESPEILKALGTENYVTRTYKERNPADPSNPAVIELHIAYYTGMIDTVPHIPDRCFVGGGLDMIESSTVTPIPLDTSDWIPDDSVPPALQGHIYTANAFDEQGRRIQRIRLPRDAKDMSMSISRYRAPRGVTITAGYFFIANGGVVPRAEQVRLLAFNLEDDYAYYMKVQTSSFRVTDRQGLAELTAGLMNELLPHLMRCVPDWVDVEAGVYPEDNPRKQRTTPPAAQTRPAS